MGHRILTYKEIVAEYGVTLWFWRTQMWQGNLKNCGPGNRHQFDRRDIEQLIQNMKQRA